MSGQMAICGSDVYLSYSCFVCASSAASPLALPHRPWGIAARVVCVPRSVAIPNRVWYGRRPSVLPGGPAHALLIADALPYQPAASAPMPFASSTLPSPCRPAELAPLITRPANVHSGKAGLASIRDRMQRTTLATDSAVAHTGSSCVALAFHRRALSISYFNHAGQRLREITRPSSASR